MRRFPALVTALLAVLTVVVSGALLAPTASAAPYCGIRWGSLPKANDSAERSVASLTNVRAGRHACFDRLVLDYAGDNDHFAVRYVPAMRGGALLEIVVAEPYGSDTEDNFVQYLPTNTDELVNVAGYKTFRQVAWVELWESNSIFGLGVRARLPFRVFTLDGPGSGSRLVIDVAHRW